MDREGKRYLSIMFDELEGRKKDKCEPQCIARGEEKGSIFFNLSQSSD